MDTLLWTVLLLLGVSVIVIMILIWSLSAEKKQQIETIQKNRESNQRFESMIEKMQGGVICSQVFPETGILKIKYMSNGWSRLTGYSWKEMKELFDSNPQKLILPEDSEACMIAYEKQVECGNNYHLQYRFVHKDGSIRWAIDRGVVIVDEDGNIENQSILTDITELQNREKQLRVSEERFRISSMASHTAIYEFDMVSNQYTYFENAKEVLGREDDQILQILNDIVATVGTSKYNIALSKMLHPDDSKVVNQASKVLFEKGESRVEVRVVTENGYVWCEINKILVKDESGNCIRIVGAVTNIDDIKRHAEVLSLQVQKESLTGLYNKMACKEIIEEILRENENKLAAMILIDIDNFKGVNDTMGHTFGDMVLVDVATRLRNVFENQEVIARIGGDEFLVFIPSIEDEAYAETAAEKICNAFRVSYSEQPQIYKISCSVGVSCSCDNTYLEFVDQADLAMYDAKHLGKDQFTIYDRNKLYTSSRIIEGTETDIVERSEKNISEMVFDLLYSTVDFVGSVNMVLSFLCNSFGFTYAYIFENTRNNGMAINTFEWTNSGERTSLPSLAPLDGEQMKKYEEFFETERYYYSANAKDYDPDAQNALGIRKINAILHLPLMGATQFRGIIGFGKESPYEKPSEDEITKLLDIVRILCVFIGRQRAGDEIYHGNKHKGNLIDSLPLHAYVTDNEHHIIFMNNLLVDNYPNASLGKKCYQCFMKRESVCDNCPKLRCGDGVASQELVTASNYHVISTAKKMDWDGKSSFLVTCLPLEERNEEA